ncbi:hypothetical protein EDC17_1002124 [Sphingobacterium alimentarium]|jgi:hypothetical protein|uniref:Protochlamydia outer membrane protein domain-containing protein n=1 Tax=Sphingobacterium alimentarium TaxID=797292 RepID=A0A4R3W3C9_9SPHI|nr:hypothetical protein [Sphingobacterium alimentarium]TCV20411.1 hypothetical protein EDC17_1002124 [Sphingobacterium alimentarium]
MNKLLFLGLSFFWANFCFAQSPNSIHEPDVTSITIQPKIGYSISKSSFNIAGNELGQNPTVLSELIWDPTNALEYGIESTLSHKKLFLRTDIALQSTLYGNVSDIDYDGDNRTSPYSTLYLSNHKGLGYSLKIQPGYYWTRSNKTSFATYASLDYSGRKLYLLNDKDWQTNNTNYIPGLNSYYNYRFPSYGVGVLLDQRLSNTLSTQIALEGYVSQYAAYGNWNLIDDFEKPKSYEHKGTGKKINARLGLSYHLTARTSLGIEYNLNHFGVSNGKDYLYSKSSGLLKARLNDANETRQAFLFNLRYSLPFVHSN